MTNRRCWIVTCEHAGNRLPSPWCNDLAIPAKILNSHEGIDIGAKVLAKAIASELKSTLFLYEETRLLVEPNRSLHNPSLFSRFTRHLSADQKQQLINGYYLPYRTHVEEAIAIKVKKGFSVTHLSIHSFTPVLDHVARNADIGLLYDPQRPLEVQFCKKWKQALGQEYRVRMNYPYRGTADGFTSYLRKQFPKNGYIGIELEVNQKLLSNQSDRIIRSISTSLSDWE